ncbi:hypothetical protein E2562_010231 [Oryza meyeriana var. granulata]|uniref:Uncharacterized protein n=1 Tax=Oryza meyeriana var. granulata TaxID=110450 RepID=A0A6G1EIJ8_9ORYZ|nr:hypothetical protein E2562_010231 [Oryza meyeriana var. granulata]
MTTFRCLTSPTPSSSSLLLPFSSFTVTGEAAGQRMSSWHGQRVWRWGIPIASSSSAPED